MATRLVLGEEAKRWDRKAKWEALAPMVRAHGEGAFAYATLQDGMEYCIDDDLGYVAFTTVVHPVFARKSKRIVLADPICAPSDMPELVKRMLASNPYAVFMISSERCAGILRDMGFKANCIGFEPELNIQTYNTKGNWKDLDLIKRARNEAKREGYVIREESIETVNQDQLRAASQRWHDGKILNEREIWIYARRPVYETEPDVRKFVAYDKNGTVIGYVFYDPMYRDGKVVGYSANTSRCDEKRYGRLATAVHMTAVDQFKTEGKEILNLCLAPFTKLDAGKYNDDALTKAFFTLSEKFGGEIYNFKGLAFNKSKYRAPEKSLYFISNGLAPANDVYLAFLSAELATSYFDTMGRLLLGLAKETLGARKKKAAAPAGPAPVDGEKEAA